MSTHKRGNCPDCGRDTALTASGTPRKHPCDGSLIAVHVPLPWPTPPLAQNDRQHWATKARAFGLAKTQARWAIRSAGVRLIPHAAVTLHYRVADNRIRDADGPAPTLKAVLDALVDEGVLPADSWQHVPSCAIQIHPPQRGIPPCMWVELRPLPQTSQSQPERAGSTAS